jgi:carbamoyltransferase
LLPPDGIVLTGGCALNVLANSKVQQAFPHLQVHVPAAPSDCGLAVGSAWLLVPPLPRPLSSAATATRPHAPQFPVQQLQYAGLPLFDLPLLNATATALGATHASPQAVAALLADHQIVGVVRGRAEHGPRALGHRSLLARPSAGMKERLNALKFREWYRPVAPVVAEEAADRVFARDAAPRPATSPFMSFAPALLADAADALPAVRHTDRTARPQTVSQVVGTAGYEPWLHAVLAEVQVRTGWAVLINTSFNSRGRPILNSLAEALALLVECDELDYVLVESWLFSKASVLEAHAQRRLPAEGQVFAEVLPWE